MPQLCLAVASLALSTSRPVCVVLLANRLSLVLPYLKWYHTLLSSAVVSKLHGKRSGQPLEYADVNDLFQRLQKKTGIDAHAHLFRHSSLTSLAKHGWRPELLRERAGHAHISSTYQLYVHPSDEELREAWEQTQERLRLNQPRQEGR